MNKTGPLQTLSHEILYCICFLLVAFKAYNSNENIYFKYLFTIVLLIATYVHLKRLFKNFNKVYNYSIDNIYQTIFELIKNLIVIYIIYNNGFNNFNIILTMSIVVAFIDLYNYNKARINNVFTKFITYDDPIIISFMIILLTLMIKLNVKEIVLYSVIYDITYHIIEYFYAKLYNLK